MSKSIRNLPIAANSLKDQDALGALIQLILRIHLTVIIIYISPSLLSRKI